MTAVTSGIDVFQDDVSQARSRFRLERWLIGAILLVLTAQLV